MKKDSYYFPHDSNAKDDPKIVVMVEEMGLEAYGIFWVLIELLRDQPNYKYPLKLLPAMARRYNTTFEKMKNVVNNYCLFEVENGEFFFSYSLITRMEAYDRKREIARKAGKKSAQKRLNEKPLVLLEKATDVQRTFNDRSTTVQPVEESREEYSKEEYSKEKEREEKENSHKDFEYVKNEIENSGWIFEVCTDYFASKWDLKDFKEFVKDQLNRFKHEEYHKKYEISKLKGFIIADFEKYLQKKPTTNNVNDFWKRDRINKLLCRDKSFVEGIAKIKNQSVLDTYDNLYNFLIEQRWLKLFEEDELRDIMIATARMNAFPEGINELIKYKEDKDSANMELVEKCQAIIAEHKEILNI